MASKELNLGWGISIDTVIPVKESALEKKTLFGREVKESARER